MDLQDVYLGKINYLKYLDISVDVHSFDEIDMYAISTLFLNIGHLTINTTYLAHIPLLDTYLPHLCCLTYKIIDDERLSSTNCKQTLWDHRLRDEIHFLLTSNENWLTIWIDHAALKDSY